MMNPTKGTRAPYGTCKGDQHGDRCSLSFTTVARAIDPADARSWSRSYGRQGRMDYAPTPDGKGYVAASWMFCDDHPRGEGL